MSIYLKKFLMEDLNAKHNTRTKGYSISINGSEFKSKSLDEIVEKIIGSKTKFANNVNWQNHKLIYNDDYEKWDNNLSEDIKKALINIMTAKTNAAKNFNINESGSAFDSFSKNVTELPTIGFNIIDKKILKNLRYCKEDNSIYIIKNNRLKLIGSLPLVQRDPSINGFCKFIKQSIGMEFNEGVDASIDWYIKECISGINVMKQHLIDESQLLQDSGSDWNSIKIELSDDVIFKPSKYNNGNYNNSLESAVDSFCLEKFWEVVPGTLFSSRIIELKTRYTTYESISENGQTYKVTVWNNFFYNVVKSGEALTEARYLKNILTEYLSEIKDDEMFLIHEVPRTYSDSKEEIGLFNYSMDNFKNNIQKGSYKTVEECTNIMLFKSWMNEDEFRFAMAWAYAALHPVTIPSNIALLLWTGGGTGKSSFVAMIKEAIIMCSNSSEDDIYFEIKGDKFDEDQRNWVPEGEVGLSKAALVNVDEATTKSIELYKNFSGSAAGNKLATRRNYENTIISKIHGKFIFTTNKGLQLTSDDGSLLRRIAIIKHNEINNVIGNKKILTNEKVVEEYKKQIPMLIKIGKDCYNEIIDMGYSSIDEYAMKREAIAKNLKESTSSEENLRIYNDLWDYLVENYKSYIQKDGSFRLRGDALKSRYDLICRQHASPDYWASFKKFIVEKIEYFTNQNGKKQSRNYLYLNDNNITFSERNSNSIWYIYPVKEQYHNKSEDDDEENVDDIVNRLDEDLEYDENGEIKVDVDYTNRPYEDVVKDIIDPMLECNLWK